MSPESQRKETDAFLSFFGTFELPHPAVTVADLSDGAALLQVLTLVSVLPLENSVIIPDTL